MLSKGDKATMFHNGSNSFYDVIVVRRRSNLSVAQENKAACGEDPRPDMTILREAMAEAKIPNAAKRLVYNDLNKARDSRRLKIAFSSNFSSATFIALDKAVHNHFGDRVIEVGHTPPSKYPPRYGTSGGWGNEIFVRLKV